MLKHLQIRNLAIIEELELDFDAGFSALTGETGAGKSILIDAIGLVTGTRGDPLMVRHGADKAEITAELAVNPASAAWLAEHELTDAGNPQVCILRRVLYAEGRTRAFINGQPVNIGQLRELGEMLISVFGQSESQTLMLPSVQRDLLDDFGQHAQALNAVAAAAHAHTELERQIARLRNQSPADPARLDFLRFQLQELRALNLGPGEVETLDAQHRQLANAGRLLQEGSAAQEALYGAERSIYDQLAAVQSQIAALVSLHPPLNEGLALIESGQSLLREAADTLRRQLGRLDLDPERFAEVERRMVAVHDMARKYRLTASALPARLEELQQELGETEGAADRIAELQQQQAAQLEIYTQAARGLSQQRQKSAKKLSAAVSEIIGTLGMPGARFQVGVEHAASPVPSAYGADEIRFDFSANPGQPPRPMARVASGGELSRLSLALQVAALVQGGAPCMIFDEVDAGIGGGTAEIVGRTLQQLGQTRQVLCVTHVAQVAAQAHHQFGISKSVRAGKTSTSVESLGDKARVEELARMQGGVEVTAATLGHARDLLKRGAGTRKS